MNQPRLGKKIVELRKAKGITQKELVDICNLNVRTIQRIESGEVTPRGYTIKLIFDALDYQFEVKQNRFNNWIRKPSSIIISLLLIIACVYSFYINYSKNETHSVSEVKEKIEKKQKDILKWINAGDVDAVLTNYRSDACVLQKLCGKENIKKSLEKLINNGYKLTTYNIISISVSDTIAIEKYNAVYTYKGKSRKQIGIFEWRFSKGKWLIVNEMYNED